MSKTLFLSTVTKEFEPLRRQLALLLRRTQRVHVREQDVFAQRGTKTLETLEQEIADSDIVLHVLGAQPGAPAPVDQSEALLARCPQLGQQHPDVAADARRGLVTYTQWEAWLALFLGKTLCPYEVKGRTSKDASQTTHAQRLRAAKRYPKEVEDDNGLFGEILLSLLEMGLLTQQEVDRPMNLPFPSLGTLFKGREAFIEQLRQSLAAAGDGQATAVVGKAVHGLGGVGKTRLAVEYAWQHADQFSAVLFVTADSPENLRKELAELAGPLVLNLPEAQAAEEEVRMAAALRWLQKHQGWFLILDNVDSEEAAEHVEQMLPRLIGGQVLITSRLANWGQHFVPLELDVLPREAAVNFLLDRTQPSGRGGRGRKPQPSDQADAEQLADELDGLALALEQAGAYIESQRVSIAEYLRRWREHDSQVQDWHRQREMKYPRSLAATWQTTIDRIEQEHGDRPIALLNLLAWFAPEPVPLFVFAHLSAIAESLRFMEDSENTEGAKDAEVADGRWSEDHVREALAILADFSMIRWEDDAIVVHRVVQEILRTQQTNAHQWISVALELLNQASPAESDNVSTWPVLDPLRPHLATIAEAADKAEIHGATTRIMGILGVLLAAKALYQDAEPFLRRALAIDEQSYGVEHPKVAIRLSNLAALLQGMNCVAEAEPLIRRALAIDEQSYGAEHPNVATRLNNLALLLQVTNRLAEAERLMHRALAIDEQFYGAEHPIVATRLSNLAMLLQDTNRFTEAEPLIRRALDIDAASYGTEHPKVASRLNNLALLFKDTNRQAEAEPLMRRGLAIEEESKGADHPHVAIQLNNLAQLLQDTNRLAEAEPLMRRALAIDEQTYGAEHPDVAIDLNNLAWLLQIMNRLAEAEPLMRRALEMLRETLGNDHPKTQKTARNLEVLLAVKDAEE